MKEEIAKYLESIEATYSIPAGYDVIGIPLDQFQLDELRDVIEDLRNMVTENYVIEHKSYFLQISHIDDAQYPLMNTILPHL